MGIKDIFNAILSPFKLMFGDPEHARILKEGRPAFAKIVELGESGMGYVTVNDQPYVKLILEVHDGNKKPYTTELKTIISRLAVPQFQPGKMVNIKIDPLDPMKVVLDTTLREETKPVIGNTHQSPIVGGKKAKAEVLSIGATDEVRNGNKVYVLKLEITGEGIEKYSFDKEIPLPEFALPYITVGKTYDCEVDGIDKTKVALDIKFNN